MTNYLPLGEVATIDSGSVFPNDYQGHASGDLPFAKVSDISRVRNSGRRVICDAVHYVSRQTAAELRAKPFPEGAIVFAKIGEAIRSNNKAITGCPMIFDNNVMGVVPNGDRIDRKYLYYFLDTVDLYKLANSTAVPALRKTDLARIQLPLPPLPEQRRIAAILDAADALRQKRRQALRLLDQLSQAIFIEMFGEWDRPGSNVPTFELGSQIDFLTSGSRGWAEHYADHGALFLRIQNVRRDELDLSDVAFVNAPETAEAKRTRVQPGDVLLSITADLGRTAVIPENIGEAYINQHLAIIRASKVEPRFLSAALSSPAGQRAILRRNREGVKAGLNFDDVRSVQLPDVSIDEQRAFVQRVKKSGALKAGYQKAVAEVDSLFQCLQHRAFRGEL